MAFGRRIRVVLLATALAAPVAYSDGGPSGPAGAATTASTPAPPDTSPGPLTSAAFVDTVTFLVEQGDGRDNLSEGSRTVQDRLVEELEAIARPLPGADGFLQPFEQGTNILGYIEGTEAPEEVVVLGAHYDHLGHDCPTAVPGDDVCDGAGDNAAGVAAVIEIGRRLAADPPATFGRPRAVGRRGGRSPRFDRCRPVRRDRPQLGRRLPQLGHAGDQSAPVPRRHHLRHRSRDRRFCPRGRGGRRHASDAISCRPT